MSARVFNFQPLGREWCASSKPVTGETSVSEVSKDLSGGSWSGMVGHSPYAWCWLLGGQVSISSPVLVWVLMCHLLKIFKLDQPVSREPVKQVRGPEIQTGLPGRQSRDLQTCVCACEPRECFVCACTSDLSLPAQAEEETWLPMLVFYLIPVCRCC